MVGAAIVASRFVIDQITPAALAMLRYAIGVVCLLPAPYLSGSTRVHFQRRDLLPIAALGITQFGVLIALLNLDLQYLPASRVALIFTTFPLLTMLLAAALGKETLTPAKTVGVLLTLVGVGLALGDAASALSGALCSVTGPIWKNTLPYR